MHPDFSVIGAPFQSKIDLKNYQNSTCFFLSFLGRFGGPCWTILGAKIDPSWAKLVSRQLLKRYVLQKVNVHEKL